MYRPKAPITTAAEVKAILGPVHPSQIAKVIDHIDEHCAKWIERCPFVVISSINAAGSMDVSPKGDPAGFVKVLDKHTLAMPDRLGNQRADTFLNVLKNPSVGIIFIVPKRREVVRIGRHGVSRERLGPSRTDGVEWEDASHCDVSACSRGLSPLREVDDPVRHVGAGSIGGLPSYAQAMKDAGELTDFKDSLESLQSLVERNETQRLY